MKIFSIIKQVGLLNFVTAAMGEMYRKIVREGWYGSYAQDYEDLEIEKYLKITIGSYLEIGAYHPTRLSNTYRFYKNGWQGVVVEPNPAVKEVFKNLRPRDEFVDKGVGIKSAKLKYYKYDIPALNTFSPLQVKLNSKNGFEYKGIEIIEIIDIKKLLKQYSYKKFDLLSLDVEGWDEKILANWDWKVKPKIICVESNGTSSKINETLKKQNYRLLFENKINSIYVL